MKLRLSRQMAEREILREPLAWLLEGLDGNPGNGQTAPEFWAAQRPSIQGHDRLRRHRHTAMGRMSLPMSAH
jgi:hypothetical protein